MAKPPSAERQKLAEAIEHVRSTTARRAAMTAALDRATGDLYAAQRRVDEAEAALVEARDGLAEHLIAQASGVAVETLSPAQAEANLAAAQNELETARAARDALQQRIDAERHDSSAMLLQDAAFAVLRAELVGAKLELLGKIERLRVELSAALSELSWFSGKQLLDKHERSPLLLLQYPIGGDYQAQLVALAVAAAKWDPLVKRLMDDAAAKLVE